jgi:RNA polymerase sigma-32 factor
MQAVKWARRLGSIEATDIAEATGNPIEAVHGVMARMNRDVSFDGLVGERLSDSAPSPEALVIAADEKRAARERVARALAKLPPRDAFILRRRVLAEDKETLDMIGKELGLTRQRVQQLEVKAMARLRSALAA